MHTEDPLGARHFFSQRARSLCIVLALAVATAACGGDDGGSDELTQPGEVQGLIVSMVQTGGGAYGDPIAYHFSPASLTISAGDTVAWTNGTSAVHTVTADDGAWNSGDIGSSGRFERVFSDSGTFRYHCTYHGAAGGVGMAGTITVEP